jgi:hypothetical protein
MGISASSQVQAVRVGLSGIIADAAGGNWSVTCRSTLLGLQLIILTPPIQWASETNSSTEYPKLLVDRLEESDYGSG